MSDNTKKEAPTVKEELNALIQVFKDPDEQESFEKYQKVLDKVTFDQSLFGIKHFGIGEQGTIHRKLRHCLLHYDGKQHTLLEAKGGVKKTLNKVKLENLKIKKLKQTIIDLKRGIKNYQDDISIEEAKIKIDMITDKIEKYQRELKQQYKLIKDAKTQVDVYKEEIERLIPLVEQDGRTFEEAESDYWKFRFVRDAECEVKAKTLGIDKGVMQSISQLPQSTQEEIVREINKIPKQLQGGGVPYEFAYKRLEEGNKAQMLGIGEHQVNDPTQPDIVIGCLKRNEQDVCVTDAENMLVIPGELNHVIDYLWGHSADTGRNMVIQRAMEVGSRYVFFIDDDTLVPRNALAILYSELKKYDRNDDKENQVVPAAIAGHYYKKTLPLESSHLYVMNGKTIPIRPEDLDGSSDIPIINCDGILAAGCMLIDLEKCKKFNMTLPYFMELRAADGDMVGTDDIHFTRKVYDHNLTCLLHTGIKCLHIDKKHKKVYGIRGEDPYAVNDINIFLKKPDSEKKIIIGVPFREGDGPENMSTKFNDINTPRGYALEAIMPKGLKVADARNEIVKEALLQDSDYVFFMDDDVKIPSEVLVELLKLDLDIVACPYPLKQDGYTEAILMKTDKGNVVSLDDYLKEVPTEYENGLMTCNWVITMGCTLIKTEVFKCMREPWFFESYRDNDKGTLITEDAYFTEKAIMSGFTPHIATQFPCCHVDREKDIIYGKPSPVGYAE